MHIEHLEKQASEKELVARLLEQRRQPKNHGLAEFLLSRIKELDRRLAILDSERAISSGFSKSGSSRFVAWTTPALWQRLPR